LTLWERLRPGGRWFPGALLVSLGLFQLLCVPGHYLGFEHDDVQYVLAARSLLEGRYSLGILPGDPPLTIASPGWPLLLTPAALVSGDNPLGYQLWTWAWLLACDALLWLWLRKRFSPSVAGAATALFALNPLVLSRAGVVMNEIPYLAFVLGAFLLFDRDDPPSGWAGGLLLAFCWLIRTASVPLVPAVLGAYASRRRWKDAGAAAAIWMSAVAAWKLWSDWAGAGLAEQGELWNTLGVEGIGALFVIAGNNASQGMRLLGESLLAWRPQPGTPTVALVVGAGAWAAAGWGMLRRVRADGYQTAAVYLGFGILLHAFWPYWYERYLPPFLPVLVFGWAAALEFVSRRAGVVLAACALLTVPGQGAVLVSRQNLRYRPEAAETYAAIRAFAEPGALFASAFYCRDAYYTGRPFIPLPTGEGPLTGRMQERGVSYILWAGLPDIGSSLGERFASARRLRDFRAQLQGPDFRVLYSNSQEKTVVFGLAGARINPGTKVTLDPIDFGRSRR